MSQNQTHSKGIKLKTILTLIRLIMVLAFLIFSYIPLISSVIIFVPQYFPDSVIIFILFIILMLFSGLIVIIGLITLKSSFRTFSIIFFSLGIIFSINDPYLLVLGIITSWAFYEFWFLSSNYLKLLNEYENYPSHSIENKKLSEIFYSQFSSYGMLVWIALSLSWGTILISNTFFIKVGDEFGTLGLSVSLGVVIFIHLVRKVFKNSQSRIL